MDRTPRWRPSSSRSARFDIFAQADDGKLTINEANLDECVLCQLCMNAAPPGSVRVIKLYDSNAVLGA